MPGESEAQQGGQLHRKSQGTHRRYSKPREHNRETEGENRIATTDVRILALYLKLQHGDRLYFNAGFWVSDGINRAEALSPGE